MTVEELHVVSGAPSPPLLTVITDVEPPALVVRLRGEIDLACADLLDRLDHGAMTGVTHIDVDLSALEFSDLTGLRALLAFRGRHAADERSVTLSQARPAVRRLFQLAGHERALAPVA